MPTQQEQSAADPNPVTTDIALDLAIGHHDPYVGDTEAKSSATATVKKKKTAAAIPKTNSAKAKTTKSPETKSPKVTETEEASKSAAMNSTAQVARTKKARQPAFRFYTFYPFIPFVEPTNADMIMFSPRMKASSGPVAFLSTFHECEFIDPTVHPTHTFISIEQYYQYCKCKLMASAERRDNDWPIPVPSTCMAGVILLMTDPLDISDAGSSYDDIADRDPGWALQWREGWRQVQWFVIKRAVSLKIGQKPELRELLLKTGDHELVAASWRDSVLGIGFPVGSALERGFQRTLWGENMLGKALMKTREFWKKKTGYTGGYDAAYWRKGIEEYFKRASSK